MKFKITQAHIDESRRRMRRGVARVSACPVAIALNDALGVKVAAQVARAWSPEDRVEYRYGPGVTTYIRYHDDHYGAAAPAEFEVFLAV